MAGYPISDLLRRPVVAAPMAGGPSAPGLVAAVSLAGALGFLAAGYKTAPAMRAEISAVRAVTAEPFGVNVFVPGAPAADPAAVAAYVGALAAEAGRLGASTGEPARFMLEHPDAPAAYPEINNATRPLRAAAAAASDVGLMSLWAGQGYRASTTRPAAEVVKLLCRGGQPMAFLH